MFHVFVAGLAVLILRLRLQDFGVQDAGVTAQVCNEAPEPSTQKRQRTLASKL